MLVDALKGKPLGGTVSEVGVTTGRTATTYPVTATLSESNDAVRPGMAAEVELELGDSAQAPRVLVNPKAVGEDREGRYVYIAEPQGEGLATVQRKAVKVGENFGLRITRIGSLNQKIKALSGTGSAP